MAELDEIPMKTGFVFHELYLWHNTGNADGFLPANPSTMVESHLACL
jgi:hypothetical protein